MVVEPLSWAALRLVGGFATGGLFVVLESWMLVSSTPANRGRLMSLYMILLYGSWPWDNCCSSGWTPWC